jgi:hypothetical protein
VEGITAFACRYRRPALSLMLSDVTVRTAAFVSMFYRASPGRTGDDR